MADPNQDDQEEWRSWKAIPSQVTEAEIKALEQTIGYALPPSFQRFLKYKHFYELHLGECSFASHPLHTWRDALKRMIFEGYPKEYLIDKGLIPFADWSDCLLCFDTNNKSGNKYSIVLWCDDQPNEGEYMASDFEALLIKLDKEEENE